jgi:DNA adenine methylase
VTSIRAPFPWFGGKRRVATVAWHAFGSNVPNYIEPFAGSLAVLLGRPGCAGKIETVNDRDRYLANFWRAVAADPESLALHADWPVNEADLHARHKWLVNQHEFRERMHSDPDFYDVKIAGWWVWGLCQWIGGGWCVEPHNQLPDLAIPARARETGRGVNRKLPHLAVKADGACAGRGIHSSAGQGVHLPSLGNDRGLNDVASPPCTEWFRALQERLRRVRVACGDWKRVLGPSVLGKGKNVGGRRPCAVFLDPPYSHELRDPYLYSEDDPAISAQVREWALEHGDDPYLRIALCGYEGEHEMPQSWQVHAWKGSRGYAGADNDNRSRERIWFSPHCLPLEGGQTSLFGRGG